MMKKETNDMELKGKKAVFLGDSITQGVGCSSPSQIYLNLLADRAELCEAKNYGISGTRFARQRSGSDEPTFDNDYCRRVEDLDVDADIVVVFGGTNDFGHGDAPLGTPEDRTPDTFWGACHYLMNRLVERFWDKTIVIMTPLHRLNEDNPRGDRKPADVANLKAYVQIIRTVAEWYSLPVLDLYAESGIQPRVPVIQQNYCPDGLHPNDAGHARIADKLYQFLLQL